MSSFGNLKTKITRPVIASGIALALAISAGTYELAKPTPVRAAVMAPAPAPLDDNSVSALLSLDNAMETLAARVTPAIVNVAVTSHAKGEQAQGDAPEDMQKF